MPLPAGYSESSDTAYDRRCVESIWTYFGQTNTGYRVLPDGRCDIILRFVTDAGRPISQISVLIAGPSTTYHMAPIIHGLGFVGIRLRPGFVTSVLGVDLSMIVDQVLDNDACIKAIPEIAALHRPAVGIKDLSDRLTRFVADRRAANGENGPSSRSLALLNAIHVSGGQLTVAQLARIHRVDERTVRRDIKTDTGLTPKQFAMIIQFHRAMHLLCDHGLDTASAAVEAGYADQAHMTRVFRQLAGFTPADRPEVTLASLKE
jgi:AraC-like DNA-binding protein